ncbi:MAG: hypothetical protein AAF337_13440 [Pseudomonadota bacterium]
MEKEVRSQAFRMLFVLLVFASLALWQLEFVIRSIEANVHLNLTIIFTFLFGALLGFRSVLSLRNEMVALKALQVQYKDRGSLPEGCYDQPASVFQPPELLGHAFRLISDELTKPQQLTLPTSTVKMLVEGVDVRIDDRKSTLTYIVGLLVFLGLIGTFVGLMQTVGSVGDIIGSLNFGGDGGPSIDEAFSGLIADLQGPLVGMATGFSSSLFGLLCSLALGLMERFGTAAHRILPLEFESWLTNIAQLENTVVDEGAAAQPNEALNRIARLEARMAATADSAEKSATAVSELLVSIHGIAETLSRDESQTGLTVLSDLAREMTYTQRGFMEQLNLIRELGESDRDNSRELTANIAQGFQALRTDRQSQDEVMTELRLAIEKVSAVQPVNTVAVEPGATAADDDADETATPGIMAAMKRRSAEKSAKRQAKVLRQEYHSMVREVLDKAFRRDTEITQELEAINEAAVRQDGTLEALVEHNRALQAQQRALSGQVEVLANILASERGDETVIEEIRRSRLGMEMALRQITSQLSDVRDTDLTQKMITQMEQEDAQERKAG